jgi:hypothetical protein
VGTSTFRSLPTLRTLLFSSARGKKMLRGGDIVIFSKERTSKMYEVERERQDLHGKVDLFAHVC